MVRRLLCGLILLVLLSSNPGAVSAQVAGQAVAVTAGAELGSGSGRQRLVKGASVSIGDVVTTDATGQVQLLFQDGTKIAVGPGSRLVIDTVLMQAGGTAQRFAVSAVGGTFRFITGNSAKPAYRISTPTATMGIRGTEFDFSVDPSRGTNVVLFRGQVQLCVLRGTCAEIRGRCTLAVSGNRGVAAVAATRDQRDTVLAGEFPFLLNQGALTRSFQTPTGSCGDLSRVRKLARKMGVLTAAAAQPDEGRAGNRDERERPEPERPEPSEPEAPPER